MSDEAKVAVVSGGSQGIGAGLVRAFLASGYRVAAGSRSIAPSDDPNLLTVSGDIGIPETGPELVARTLERFGRVDTLVNNAGVFAANAFTKYSADDYSRVIAANLGGFFFTTQAAIAAMVGRGEGHVVSITTALVSQPLSAVPSVLASLSKGGVDAATRSLAIEYASRGIRVNAVAPGIIKTPMHAPEAHEALGALHPVGRMGEIDEVVDAVMFLERARFVTGETLHVDGGQAAGR
ncbi:3-oxoacyl-ACP reductase [Acuticoccus sediminis]|uniref:3-oxoacyl-ACP reductase n=1 Tax=Acuticoccus sediminis TaxID=2184697 RepID=A0A8B2NZW8_9HYPH|nr:SDR family oxidoreductase [Acuticoccus sediminis]RAI01567.1 3-oxoacyl-ACP reductase [Acuticoccus sediminis]